MLVVVIVIAIVVGVSSIEHTNGRSTSYNDGWGWVARKPAGEALKLWGAPGACAVILTKHGNFDHENEPLNITVNPHRFIAGCHDALGLDRRDVASAKPRARIPSMPS